MGGQRQRAVGSWQWVGAVLLRAVTVAVAVAVAVGGGTDLGAAGQAYSGRNLWQSDCRG